MAQAALLKYTRVELNASLMSSPAPAPLRENLLDREVFDYDFSRERVFLEIADAEIAARRQAEAAKARAASDKADSDEELARQSARLSLSGGPKPRSASEEDVAAAISASLREY